jgi:hypothetical protein
MIFLLQMCRLRTGFWFLLKMDAAPARFDWLSDFRQSVHFTTHLVDIVD